MSYKNLGFLLAFPERSGDPAAWRNHSYVEAVSCAGLGHVPTIHRHNPDRNSVPGFFIPSGSWPGPLGFLPGRSGDSHRCVTIDKAKSMLEAVHLLIRHLLSIYFLQGFGREGVSQEAGPVVERRA